MLISQSWVTRLLRAADWTVSPEQLDAGYVRVGFETEGYRVLEGVRGPLVFGRVEQIEELTGFKKPIRYCQVDVGDANGTGELQGIICGARNFAAGDLVVVSLPGAVLPGGFEIAARKTYDHISNGMICSAMELGLTDQQNKGIITLPDDFGEPGEDAKEKLGIDDTVFEVNITPDRGYALSARGLTRELASAFNLTYTDPALDPSVAGIDVSAVPAADDTTPPLPVTVEPETQCRRFAIRKVSGIDPNAETPFWMQRELMLCGQRPVNVPTDVTNYVMFLLGLPMHAFDADKITGGLTVRNARPGETMQVIDHTEHSLDPEDVVICDETGPQSIAGVMGGSTSEIAEDTTTVYFEAAVWEPVRIARTSRRQKISSDASRRFERGVDSQLVEVALDVACALLAEIAGGEISTGRFLTGAADTMRPITMDVTYPSTLAGYSYSADAVEKRLREIGATVERAGDELTVTPPTWRPDLSEKPDLVEEVTRLEGLDKIVPVLPHATYGQGLKPDQKRRRAVTHALAYEGYLQILPSPFIANDTFDVWGLDADDERRHTVHVQNPLDADAAQLGSTLLPSMLDALRRNVVRGKNDISIYAVQQVAITNRPLAEQVSPMPQTRVRPADEDIQAVLDSLPYQPLHVATVGAGSMVEKSPLGEARDYTYADAIESARIVARAADVEVSFVNTEHLPWHPGRCAAILVGEQVVGYAGELHPTVLEKLELPARTCAMELDLTALPFNPTLPAPMLSAYPSLLQDVALVVDESVPAQEVEDAIVAGAGELLEQVTLFDIYRSEALGENKKSLAYALTFRAPDRTLTEDEASQARLAAVELAGERVGATLRA
ncbi:MAG: phenylalanine--tRNA ligase subunit beta [Corynebacterium sp.]|nr:phenylalanine--tRNA ligase subunit beta [Corynebacterium sp.]